jgi:hypothetical protein
VGIWHETYRIRAGDYECVYSGMPLFGLAKASTAVDAVGQLESARGRLEATEGTGREPTSGADEMEVGQETVIFDSDRAHK